MGNERMKEALEDVHTSFVCVCISRLVLGVTYYKEERMKH